MEILNVALLSLVSGWLYLTILLWLDRRSAPKMQRHVLLYFLLSGAVSALLAIVVGQFVGGIVRVGRSHSDMGVILPFWWFTAPSEEICKYSCFALTAWILKSIKEPQDGSVQGAATGLGFALLENLLYGVAGGSPLLLLRIFVSLPGHMIFGAVWGGYHGYEVYQGAGRLRRPSTVLMALVPAMFAHATFNSLVTLGAPLAVDLSVELPMLVFGGFLFLQLRKLSPYRADLDLSDWKRAVPELEHALAVDPDAYVLLQRLSAYLIYLGKPEVALIHLNRADDLRTGDPWTAFYRSAALSRLGQTSESAHQLKSFQQAVGVSTSHKASVLFRKLVQVDIISKSKQP